MLAPTAFSESTAFRTEGADAAVALNHLVAGSVLTALRD